MNLAEIKPNTLVEYTGHNKEKQTVVTVFKQGSLWYCKKTFRSTRADWMVDESFFDRVIEYREPKEEKAVEQTVFGKYANRLGYSDIEPFEVISEPKEGVKIIRGMKVSDSPINMDKLDFHPGGFCGTYANQGAQKWQIESDPDGGTMTIRLHKNGDYKSSGGGRFRIEDTPVKFYDFNF